MKQRHVRLPDPPLLLVTDRRQALRPLPEVLGAAFAAGVRWASVREKDLPEPEQIALARSLLPLARRFGARLTLHGSAAAAKEAGVDGLHLAAGQDAAAARAVLGEDALIGASIHSLGDAARLNGSMIDYALAGPAYETASKPGYGPALGPHGITAIARAAPIPVLAIGGVTPDDVAALIEAGAAGIAVMGTLMRSNDPSDEARLLLAALESARLHDQ